MGSLYQRKYKDKERNVVVSPTWWLKYFNGSTIRESSGTTDQKKAQKMLDYKMAQVKTGTWQEPKKEKIRFDELAEDYVNEYRINGRKSLLTALNNVERLKVLFAGRRIKDITPALIERYKADRQKDGYSNASINRHLAALKRMFSIGAKQKNLKNAPYISMLVENNVRTGFFEHDEFLAIRAALPDYLKPVATIAYHTGMRKGEILALKWEQVDMERGRIVLEAGTTKNNEGRTVYMTADLHRVLSAWKRERDLVAPNYPMVCFELEDGKASRIIGKRFSNAWKAATCKIGLEGKLLHDFRRTAVRNMVRAGIPERVSMRISGHKTRSVFDRYNVTSETDLAEAAIKLNAYQGTGHNLGTTEGLKAEMASNIKGEDTND